MKHIHVSLREEIYTASSSIIIIIIIGFKLINSNWKYLNIFN